MTLEHRIVVSLADIKAVSLECKKCRTRKTIPPEMLPIGGSFLDQCDVCGHPWWSSNGVGSSKYNKLVAFMEAIHEREKIDEKIGFTLLLEFDEPRS